MAVARGTTASVSDEAPASNHCVDASLAFGGAQATMLSP
jgi:hypothetical protein